MNIRINKFLADAGVASRRGADKLIEAGKVKVDGVVAESGLKIVGNEEVTVSGKPISIPDQRHYILYNKPVGVIVTTNREMRDNIMDRIEKSKGTLPKARLFPVGRLDVASQGLIMLTDDAEVATALSRPEGGHAKVYRTEVDKPLTDEALAAWRGGLRVMGRKTSPAKVKRIAPRVFEITLTEGRNRQIRRMCEAVGYEVIRLERVEILGFSNKDLRPGQWRELDEHEVETLKKQLGV